MRHACTYTVPASASPCILMDHHMRHARTPAAQKWIHFSWHGCSVLVLGLGPLNQTNQKESKRASSSVPSRRTCTAPSRAASGVLAPNHTAHTARGCVFFSFLSFLLVWWIICLWKPHSTFCLAGLHVIHASLSWLNCVKPYCSVWRLASLFLYFVAKQSLDKLHKKNRAWTNYKKLWI